MKISKYDYEAIYDHLIRLGERDEFVAFSDDPFPVHKEELFSFSTREEALEFCREMSTDIEPYNYLSIESAYRAMSDGYRGNTLLIEKNELVDVSLMIAARHQRLEAKYAINNQIHNNQKSKIMNQKNFEYLRDQVKYTGFGEGLENDLKQKIEEGKPEFKLQHHTKYGDDSVTTTLNFSQSKQSDMYFFNSYQATLQKENNPEKMEQTFYVNKGGTITLKEAYNLMQGRAVNKDLTSKEGQVYNAWLILDFKQTDKQGNYKLHPYHQNYEYDFEAALSKHPIRELENEQYKSNLMNSLKKGNRQSVTFDIDGKDEKRYIEANPRFKTIKVYDSNMQPIDKRQKKEKESESQDQSVKQDSKKEKQVPDEDDGPEIPKKSKKRKKTQSVS